MPPSSSRLPAFLIAIFVAASVSPAAADTVALKLRFGILDEASTNWSGKVDVHPGQVAGVRGWRFEVIDEVTGTGSWKARTRADARQRRSNRPDAKRAVKNRPLDNGVIVTLEDVTNESQVTVQTAQGGFELKLSDLPYGTFRTELGGRLEIERVAPSRELTAGPGNDDFPAAAVDGQGRTHVAWVRFSRAHPERPRIQQLASAPENFDPLAEPPIGDQVWLARLSASGLEQEIAITEPGRDIFRCAVAVDGTDRVWVFWAEKRGEFFEVWARALSDGTLGAPIRISEGTGNAHSAVATTDTAGRVWVAWQGVQNDVFRIFVRRQLQDSTFDAPQLVSPHAASAWAPAIAATRPEAPGDPRVAVVWDTYEKGDYDIWLREYAVDGQARDAEPVANDPGYQARVSAAYDARSNLWLAWEESSPTWGKDRGHHVRGAGVGLLENREIGLVVRSPDGEWLETKESVRAIMPESDPLAVPRPKPDTRLNEAARAARHRIKKPYHNLSRLGVDASGRVWLLFRSRARDFRPPVGSMWLEWAAFYENDSWTGPILIPNSGNLLYSVPAVVAPPTGGLLLVYPTDHRQELSSRAAPYTGPFDVKTATTDPYVNDLFVARLEEPTPPAAAELVAATKKPTADTRPSEATIAERQNIAHARTARADVRGTEWELLRGEFHRHTEFSSDGGVDGPLEDMWRYAIDVADLDWVGNGDHDSGNDRPYPWWLIQKTTDAYYIPKRFTTVYSYERSRPYPEGHRNVIFFRRGIRPLPRLPIAKEADTGPAADTEMLYRYVEQFEGISAPHTSGTTMGTDWRNRSDEFEPVVEIYQGSRNSYEMPGAPRTATDKRMMKAERKEGFISNALAKGHRLGFISSSDHHSTHISYAMLWVKDASRESIRDAFRNRRVYAATDDIVADVRIGTGDDERFMGEELTTTEAQPLRIRLHGTGPFAKVVVVKDGKEVGTFTPGEESVSLDWTDPEPKAGATSHYYVRGEQEDGQLVWTSPIWVSYEDRS